MTDLTETERKAELRNRLRGRRASLSAETLREKALGFIETGREMLD